MARLFPKIDASEIDNPGERKMAEALVSQTETPPLFKADNATL
jgi:hypothetical protein